MGIAFNQSKKPYPYPLYRDQTILLVSDNVKAFLKRDIEISHKYAVMKLLLLLLVTVTATTLLANNILEAEAFCIFNCAAEDLKNRLQIHVDCLQTQILAGFPGRTGYSTEDLDSSGEILTIGGVQYTEEELRNEWKANPDRHSLNCYFTADVTPQEVERVYQESLK